MTISLLSARVPDANTARMLFSVNEECPRCLHARDPRTLLDYRDVFPDTVCSRGSSFGSGHEAQMPNSGNQVRFPAEFCA